MKKTKKPIIEAETPPEEKPSAAKQIAGWLIGSLFPAVVAGYLIIQAGEYGEFSKVSNFVMLSIVALISLGKMVKMIRNIAEDKDSPWTAKAGSIDPWDRKDKE